MSGHYLVTLGSLRLQSASGEAPRGAASQRKPLLVLAAVAAAGRDTISRNALATLFWPTSPSGQARSSLKQVLFSLRRDLAAPDLFLGKQDISVNPACLTADCMEFDRLAEEGHLGEAVRLHRGPFLAGVTSPVPSIEQWLGETRRRFDHRAVRACELIAEQARAAGRPIEALDWLERASRLDPLSDRLAIAVSRAHLDLGDRSAALRSLGAHLGRLADISGLVPGPELLAWERELRDHRDYGPGMGPQLVVA